MFKHKNDRSQLNKAVRIGYLKIKKNLGSDETQELAAEIWKLTSEEQQRIKTEEASRLSHEFIERLMGLFEKWAADGMLSQDAQHWAMGNIFKKAFWMLNNDTSIEEMDRYLDDITPVRLRIRKLTPRECFRLMDVSEEDIDKIANSGVSNSQQYKMAGNSIVVNVLYEIFKSMFVDDGEPQVAAGTQLTLF